MKIDLKSLQIEIEAAIQSQSSLRVAKLVREYLQETDRSPAARFQASEYFRRLSNYPAALEVLRCQSEPTPETSDDELKIFIQHIRLRNLMGSSLGVTKFLKKLSDSQKREYSGLLAPVLCSNYLFEKALPLLEPLAESLKPGADYSTRLRTISLADTLEGLGRSDEALELFNRIHAISPEPLIKAILHEARGTLFLKQKKLAAAEREYRNSLSLFPKGTQTVDLGFLYKCIAALEIEKKNWKEAKRHLDRAWKLLYRKGYKPEIWLEVLWTRGLLEFRKKPKTFPAEWKTLLAYPQPSAHLKEKISTITDLPTVLDFELPKLKSKWTFDFENDVLGVEKGNFEIGLSVPQKMMGYLLAAYPYGIPQYRMYDALWSESWASETQLKKRFEQAVFKNRKEFPFDLKWKEGHLDLIPKRSGASLHWSNEAGIRGGQFFLRGLKTPDAVFSRQDLERFFGIQRSVSDALLNLWFEAGRIQEIAKGKYRLASTV